MENDAKDEEIPKKKGLLKPLLIGLILAAIGGGGGFWAVTQGPLASTTEDTTSEDHGDDGDYAESSEGSGQAVAFIELETLVITLGEEESGRNLIFSAALEVAPPHQEEVADLTPRILDVLNSYLRVISPQELSEPASLARLRAQMLRRIQVVVGEDKVRDLLVTQFLVN